MPLYRFEAGRVCPAFQHALAHDAPLYRELSLRVPCCLAPPAFMLPYMGPDACALFERRASDAPSWLGFRQAVTALYPDIPVRTLVVAADGTRLDSVPERLAYELLRPRLPTDITLVLHPRIPIPGRRFKADFGLVDASGCVLHIEVAGAVARYAAPQRERELHARRKLDAKLAACVQAGLAAPTVLYADEICDRERLDLRLDQIMATVREALL